MRKILLVFLSVLSLVSCINWNDMALRRPLRPEDTREYKLNGTFAYLTIDTVNQGYANGMVIMFRNGPDLSVPALGGIEGFLIDQASDANGISRIAIRYNNHGMTSELWFLDSYSFTLQTNAVNYLGRFAVDEKLDKLELRLTNVLEKDRERFAASFPNLTNFEFVPVDLKKE